MAMAKRRGVIISSDCQAALDAALGGYSAGFSNLINHWSLGEEVTVRKVRAHPERFKQYSEWDWDDKGIWTADRVAGSEMTHESWVSAASWLKRIAKRARVTIEEADGTPFIGNVSERISRTNMQKYWKIRDEYRIKDGLSPKWEGTNIALASSLLKRNGGLEDLATMLRFASRKRWDYSRHNITVCKACRGDFRGMRHPLLLCNSIAVMGTRKIWMDSCFAHIRSAKPEQLRPRMLEYLHHATKSEGGEFACVGTFLPSWVDRLSVSLALTAFELRAMKRFMRVVAVGGRLVMREYARIREVAEGDARPLRQLSMVQFVEGTTSASDSRKTRDPAPPPMVTAHRTQSGQGGITRRAGS